MTEILSFANVQTWKGIGCFVGLCYYYLLDRFLLVLWLFLASTSSTWLEINKPGTSVHCWYLLICSSTTNGVVSIALWPKKSSWGVGGGDAVFVFIIIIAVSGHSGSTNMDWMDVVLASGSRVVVRCSIWCLGTGQGTLYLRIQMCACCAAAS